MPNNLHPWNPRPWSRALTDWSMAFSSRTKVMARYKLWTSAFMNATMAIKRFSMHLVSLSWIFLWSKSNGKSAVKLRIVRRMYASLRSDVVSISMSMQILSQCFIARKLRKDLHAPAQLRSNQPIATITLTTKLRSKMKLYLQKILAWLQINALLQQFIFPLEN